MSRRRNEFQTAELGFKAILTFLILISLVAGGLAHFTQVLTGLIELLVIVGVATAVVCVGITVGVSAYKDRRPDPFLARPPPPILTPGEKGALSNLVWPDGKGTTLRPPEEVSGDSIPPVAETAADCSPPVHCWTEAEVLSKIHELDWYQFEKFNTQLLKAEGWDATHFRSEHGDGGKDIVAKRNGRTLFVQCKALSSPVPEKVVRELLGSLSVAGAASGAIHAAGPFSISAQAFSLGGSPGSPL